jgi:hypothetical protein
MEHEEGSVSHSTATSGIFLLCSSKFYDYPHLSKLHFLYDSTVTSGPEPCRLRHSFLDTPHSAQVLWTRDQPGGEIST